MTLTDSTGGKGQPERLGLFASLGNRNFRWFLFGQAASTSGLWTQRVAQDWLVLELTNNAFAVGVTTAMQFLPTLVFGVHAGLVADRFDKRKVLLATVATLGLSALVLGLLIVTGQVQLWHVLAIAFITGTAACYDNPTRAAWVREIVGSDRLRNAVSLNSAVFQLGALAGPALSAFLITVLGTGWAFIATAGWYVVVLSAFFMIKSNLLQASAPLARARGQLREALREIYYRPDLLWPMVILGVSAFFTINYAVVLTAYAKDFQLTAAGYGLLTVALAIGSLFGALVSARWPGTRLRHLVGLTAAVALAQVVTALMPSMVTVMVGVVLIGLTTMPFMITVNTSVQLAASEVMQGRVMGVFMLVNLGSATIGGPVIGLLAQFSGAPAGFIAGGLAMMIVAILVGLRLAQLSKIEVRSELRVELAKLRVWLAFSSRPGGHR